MIQVDTGQFVSILPTSHTARPVSSPVSLLFLCVCIAIIFELICGPKLETVLNSNLEETVSTEALTA